MLTTKNTLSMLEIQTIAKEFQHVSCVKMFETTTILGDTERSFWFEYPYNDGVYKFEISIEVGNWHLKFGSTIICQELNLFLWNHEEKRCEFFASEETTFDFFSGERLEEIKSLFLAVKKKVQKNLSLAEENFEFHSVHGLAEHLLFPEEIKNLQQKAAQQRSGAYLSKPMQMRSLQVRPPSNYA